MFSKTDYGLIPFDDFLLFAKVSDLSHYRVVPDRILEQFLSVPENFLVTGDEVSE
ncbi:MAG: hypothetical protein WCP20_18900 [Desulfuromonadales bacterium]